MAPVGKRIDGFHIPRFQLAATHGIGILRPQIRGPHARGEAECNRCRRKARFAKFRREPVGELFSQRAARTLSRGDLRPDIGLESRRDLGLDAPGREHLLEILISVHIFLPLYNTTNLPNPRKISAHGDKREKVQGFFPCVVFYLMCGNKPPRSLHGSKTPYL